MLIWLGGGATALIALAFGIFALRYTPASTSPDSSTPSPSGSNPPASTSSNGSTPSASSSTASPYFDYLVACEGKGERACERDNALFDEAVVSTIQVDAITKNLKKGDKIKVLIKFSGPAGSTEKPYPVPYEVKNGDGERVFAVIKRSEGRWNLGTYKFEFIVEGKPGPPGQKSFAILKNGKAEQ